MKILLMISLILVASCGKKVKVVKPADPEAYHYTFGNKECTTGEHNYYNLNDACKALLRDDLNNNCAEEERMKLYATSCEGQFES